MRPAVATQTYSRQEWTRRFAYRAMLVRPSLDSVSAVMVAEEAFDGAHTRDPEAAAEASRRVAGLPFQQTGTA